MYFMTVLFEAIKASCTPARERGERFEGFEDSAYASGEFFRKWPLTRSGHPPRTSAASCSPPRPSRSRPRRI